VFIVHRNFTVASIIATVRDGEEAIDAAWCSG
jgi:hypothetical protein